MAIGAADVATLLETIVPKGVKVKVDQKAGTTSYRVKMGEVGEQEALGYIDGDNLEYISKSEGAEAMIVHLKDFAEDMLHIDLRLPEAIVAKVRERDKRESERRVLLDEKAETVAMN